MLYKSPNPWTHALTLVITLVLVLLLSPRAVQANTEKAIFQAADLTPSHQTKASISTSNAQHAAADNQDLTALPLNWVKLKGPYSIQKYQTISPSYDPLDVTMRSGRRRRIAETENLSDIDDPTAVAGREVFNWYLLESLEPKASFELRISYPATSPADFEIKIMTLDQVQEELSATTSLSNLQNTTIKLDRALISTNALVARVKGTYTGISYKSGPEVLPIPYNIVLERLYFAVVPYQALKLALAIAVCVIGGLFVLSPRIHKALMSTATLAASEQSLDVDSMASAATSSSSSTYGKGHKAQ